ncbi:unnamed protein product [Didymodactylos carnosus]|uniref:Uncharacterized protein n=1 Tax=Didymodactylos carnosus TaxID=1234261 RepID=A0A814DCT3_9BILA|nr:unnamed protein product [Didymodactylos carnosus]CAF3726986.1 unnamed protein product [Didymodactylos carnosus]
MYCGDNVHHETENVNVTIEPNGGEYFADIKKFTVSSNSFQDNQKSIYKIVATKSDGTKLEVRQPFDDVPGSAPKNWLFEIRDKEIKSIDPKKSGQ